jgi:hypothetical protein
MLFIMLDGWIDCRWIVTLLHVSFGSIVYLMGDSLRNRTKLDEGSSKSLKLGNLVYHSIP